MARTKNRSKSHYSRELNQKRNSQDTKSLRDVPAFIFADGTPPGVFFDGVDEPNPEVAENLKLPREKYQFFDDNEAKSMAQINYIMWAAGAPENSVNKNADNTDGNFSTFDKNQRRYPSLENYSYGIAPKNANDKIADNNADGSFGTFDKDQRRYPSS